MKLDFDACLARPGLAPQDRIPVRILTCIWPGDEDGLRHCLRLAPTHQVSRQEVEEMLLQAILFCGFPRVINAVRALESEWPSSGDPAKPTTNHPAAQQRAAGEELFRSIYADKTDTVREMLRSYHEELEEFVLDAAYGRILSRPGLDARRRELAAVGVLALTDQIPQLIAHGRGAQNFGASGLEIREAIYTAIGDESASDRLARRI